MTEVFRGQVFAFENVSEMGVTISAKDFRTLPVGIRRTPYSTLNFTIKAWPATVGRKFVLGIIKGCIAALACIGATRFKMFFIFTGECPFGTFMNEYPFFFGG